MNTPFAKHQFKYTFNGSNEDVPVEITFEVDGHTSLSQIIQQFEYYLKACSFHFDGHLDIVDEDDYTNDTIDNWDKNFGLKETSSSLEKDDWDENAFHEGLNEMAKKSDEKIKKSIKEWNEGIAKLENDLKAKRDIEQQAYERAARNAAIIKNNWVHGICNPPSPDYKVNL